MAPPASPPAPPPTPPHRVSLSLMVVPEGQPTRKVGPLRRRTLVFRFVSARSNGKSVRQAAGQNRQPLLGDLHVANLYSDKVFAERQMQAMGVLHADVRRKCERFESEAHIAMLDANRAYSILHDFPEFVLERDHSQTQNTQIRQLLQRVNTLTTERDDALQAQGKADQQRASMKAASQSASRELKQVTARVSSALTRADNAMGRADQAMVSVKKLSGDVAQLRSDLRASVKGVAELDEAPACSLERIAELEAGLVDTEAALEAAEARLTDTEEQLMDSEAQLTVETAKTAPKRGRPAGRRGADWLVDLWDTYTPDARKQAFWRHCQDTRAALEQGAIDNWLPSALAVVLDSISAGDHGSWVDVLFASRPFCKRKNALVKDLDSILHAEWSLDLAQHALVEVGLSQPQYQSLRNAFSKSLFRPVNSVTTDDAAAGMYSKRPWYECEVTGAIFHLPEPLPPLWRLQEHLKCAVEPLGLTLSVDGNISERSFLETLKATFRRDASHLKVFDVKRPAHPCFGIDHATISGARDFTQGGITMGGCYKEGSLLSEQKHVTLCIGRHHDDGKGLMAMLGPKQANESAGESRPSVVGIAKEFEQLSDSGVLDMGGDESIPCEPVVCLDLAAFRGITQKRGKCAALCACRGLASLQSYPGANGIPDLPEGDTLADFRTAQAVAQSQCGYGTSIMALPSLRDATHRLPEGWDFDRDGPWSCSWCKQIIYTAPGQQLAIETRLAALRARISGGKASDKKEAKRELDGILKEHADLHGDALLLAPLIMTNASGTKPFIVDPMHCLELNLLKTLWKYAIGDRMTDDDRELVATYLSDIGLHLDIRAKGKRDPQAKWFSAAQVDEFVLGDSVYKKSKSPGLVKNVLAIIEIIFDKPLTAVPDLTDAPDAAAPPPSSQRRHAKIATQPPLQVAMALPRLLQQRRQAQIQLASVHFLSVGCAVPLTLLGPNSSNTFEVATATMRKWSSKSSQHSRLTERCFTSGVHNGQMIRMHIAPRGH